jgi:hypothetical protein
MLAHIVFENFQEYFKIVERVNIMQDIDQVNISLAPNFPAWPPNMYAAFL